MDEKNNSQIEKFMFKKISVWIFLLFGLIFLLITLWFGYLVTNSKTARKIAEFPNQIKNVLNNNLNKNQTFLIGDKYINKPKFKRFISNKRAELLLMSRYNGDLQKNVVEIVDLNNFSVLHTYDPDIDNINNETDTSRLEFKNLMRDRSKERYRIFHPLLLGNGDLVFHGDASPLTKVDICSNVLWVNDDDVFHHSINIDHEKNYWVASHMFPYSDLVKKYKNKYGFREDAITKISPNGKILYQKSVTEMLLQINKLEVPDLKFDDPIHVNDIQPALSEGPHWKRGDVFISLRYLSLIIQFRPSNSKIINLIHGPYYFQHDVDIISNKEISIFNNNNRLTDDGEKLYNSEVIIYNFEKKKFSKKFNQSLIDADVKTGSEGLSEILKDGSMLIEEQNFGRILMFDPNGNLEWEYVNKANDGKIYFVNWSRIIDNKELITNIKSVIKNNTCEK